MDKKSLNNEIILCRPYVRKARVAVIRKILKKIKILKSCKKEALKKKKEEKSERLFNKVQILKKLKEDEVTKFCLKNKDIEEILRKPKLNLKTNALASLAKHSAVLEKVNAIREKIPNWEEEVPALLNSLGKKKKVLTKSKEMSILKNNPTNCEKQGKTLKSSLKTTSSSSLKKCPSKITNSPHLIVEESTKEEEEEQEPPIKAQKIQDPFFIEKQVIAPKLLSERTCPALSDDNFKRKSFRKSVYSVSTKTKPVKRRELSAGVQGKESSYQSQEKLHPSWAAKKQTYIKPFQGKKITFSHD